MLFDLEEELKKLPASPGVYLMHNNRDEIIYVGKAISLKNRVRQYFQSSRNKTAKIQQMVSHIAWFEYILTDSELEALVLECNLIKEHRPRYNTMLKDDKTYPYIKATIWEDFPRLLFSRDMKKDGRSRYFGPYTSAGAVKDSLELIHKLYRIRTCNRSLPKDTGKERPCLNYHIHQCDAPCQGYISKEEFLALLTYFEIYYRGTNDFFPLANIYLSLEQYDKAKEAVLNGILLATTNYDFRQIKYLSKLIHMYSVFDFHQRKQIYDYINAHITFYDMNPNLSYNYNTYKNEISSFLLNNNRSGIATSEIDIVTNVYPNEPDKLGILLATLEEIIEHGKSNNGEHEILCRHNSAEEIVITIQDMYQALQVIIPMVFCLAWGIGFRRKME